MQLLQWSSIKVFQHLYLVIINIILVILHPPNHDDLDIKQLRREAHNVSLNTIIEVDRKQVEELEKMNEQSGQGSTHCNALDLKIAFNLGTVFGKSTE